MVDSQEIIERSFYSALLDTTKRMGLTLDPSEYPKAEVKKYEQDIKKIKEEKGFYIKIFGVGSNQSKGMKEDPRIVITSQGFMPGNVGLNKLHMERVNTEYIVSETPFEAIDQYIDVRLVCNNIEHARLLHQILYRSIPQRGYLKPWVYEKAPFSGNIFVVATNFYDDPNTEHGLIEKVYTWEVQDTLIAPPVPVDILTPIKEIDVDIVNPEKIDEHLHISK